MPSPTLRRLAATAAFGLAPLALPLAAAGNPLTLAPESRLWVSGTSTVRSFECQARTVNARIETSAPDAIPALLADTKAVGAVTVTVPASGLDCRNGTMNSHMLKALKAAENPTITFRVSGYDLDGGRGTLRGDLSLGGVTRPVTIGAAGTAHANGALRVTGSHELLLSDYGLKAPSLMMGTMKVGNAVRVHFDLVLQN